MSNLPIIVYIKFNAILLSLICTTFLSAQSIHDSLLLVYEHTTSPLEKGMVLEELFKDKMNTDYEMSRGYLEQMLVLANKENIDTLIQLHYLHLSTHYLITSRPDKADSLNKILELMIDTSEISQLTKLHFMNRGNYFFASTQYASAAKEYLKVKHISEIKNDSLFMSSVAVNIGGCFMKINDNDKALNEFLPAYQYFTRISETHEILVLLCSNIARVYIKKGDRKKGEEYFLKGLSVAQENAHPLKISYISGNLSVFYMEGDELDKAKKYIDIALSIAKENKLWSQYIGALKMSGMYHMKSGNYDLSINYLNQALDLALEKNTRLSIVSIYDNLHKAHLGNREYKKAINYYKTSIELKDSLEGVQKANEIQELNIKYESAIKDTEIRSQELEIQQQTNKKNLFTISSILLGLLAASIFFFMRNKMTSARKLADKDREIKIQKINKLEKEKTILSMSSMIQGQEAERKRIAQDLHDGLGGLLATVKVKFGIIQNKIEELESLNVYKEANTLLDSACTEVRKIAHNMMPESLTKLGLFESVKDIAGHYGEMKVEAINLGMHPLDETKQIMLYRVIQEFLNNTRKHAVASQVIIQFSKQDDKQLIYLEDDGGGFDMFEVDKSKGMGLSSMESRINYIGGRMEMSSAIGVGTTMTISVPISSKTV